MAGDYLSVGIVAGNFPMIRFAIRSWPMARLAATDRWAAGYATLRRLGERGRVRA